MARHAKFRDVDNGPTETDCGECGGKGCVGWVMTRPSGTHCHACGTVTLFKPDGAVLIRRA